MSTLEYLDRNGSVRSYGFVPWKTLNEWLSHLNGGQKISSNLPKGVNRGRVLEELDSRRKSKKPGVERALGFVNVDLGFGKDWREYENDEGYTHLEELLIFQPLEWRKQAREYLLRFECDLSRESNNEEARTIWADLAHFNEKRIPIFLKSTILVVLFHPKMSRTSRYEPLNFLLAYSVPDPLPALFRDLDLSDAEKKVIMADLSPLDYFLEFQKKVSTYKLDLLRKMGKEASLPRLFLIKELDFSDIIGQRLAKKMIRQSVVSHVWGRSRKDKGISVSKRPLSMIFAGPSGNGKTELAHWLAKLMNKPNDDFFIKVDCGKLTDASEIFGMSGPYYGSKQGSALNNFVLKMALEPQAIGIVLLDEIEKADSGVIHALYQVIDKGEWTNKKLTSTGSQTNVISCHNLIFIMTTNACDHKILDFVKIHSEIYTAESDALRELGSELGNTINHALQFVRPFTDAFIGRIGHIVPFLPMANGNPDTKSAIHSESMTVAKILIERQQEILSGESSTFEVKQMISAETKHKMAKIIVKGVVEGGGVRAIQTAVEQHMGDRIIDALLLEEGGIENGSHVHYSTKEENDIDFRVKDLRNDQDGTNKEERTPNYDCEEDPDIYG